MVMSGQNGSILLSQTVNMLNPTIKCSGYKNTFWKHFICANASTGSLHHCILQYCIHCVYCLLHPLCPLCTASTVYCIQCISCIHCILHPLCSDLTILDQRHYPHHHIPLFQYIHHIHWFDLFSPKTMSILSYTTIPLHPLHSLHTTSTAYCIHCHVLGHLTFLH